MSKSMLTNVSTEILLNELKKRNVFIPCYLDEDSLIDLGLDELTIKKYIKFALDDSELTESISEIVKQHIDDNANSFDDSDDESLEEDDEFYNDNDDE